MQVLVNTDDHVKGSQRLSEALEAEVRGTLERFRDRLTRVEIHLADVNAGKGGEEDKRCLMEARINGKQPLAVSHSAATIDQAVGGASEKLVRALDHMLGKLDDPRANA